MRKINLAFHMSKIVKSTTNSNADKAHHRQQGKSIIFLRSREKYSAAILIVTFFATTQKLIKKPLQFKMKSNIIKEVYNALYNEC